MSANHTPGPWVVSHKKRHKITKESGLVLANAVKCSNPNYEANARLIAAAPELLDALKDMLDYYGTASANVEFLTKARAAIAKATGQDAKA